MAVTPRLDLKQSQSLLMTQQLRQAISLLQVSNLELESIIAKELESNPLLERENDRLADSDAGGQTIDDYDTPPPAAPDTEAVSYTHLTLPTNSLV